MLLAFYKMFNSTVTLGTLGCNFGFWRDLTAASTSPWFTGVIASNFGE